MKGTGLGIQRIGGPRALAVLVETIDRAAPSLSEHRLGWKSGCWRGRAEDRAGKGPIPTLIEGWSPLTDQAEAWEPAWGL